MKAKILLLVSLSILSFLSCENDSSEIISQGLNVIILDVVENEEGDFLFKFQSYGEEFETYTVQIEYLKDGSVIADGFATGSGKVKTGEIIEALTSSEVINSTDDYDCTEYKILFTEEEGSELYTEIPGPKCN